MSSIFIFILSILQYLKMIIYFKKILLYFIFLVWLKYINQKKFTVFFKRCHKIFLENDSI